jgi:GNAT superfamily N-acetyltransferase
VALALAQAFAGDPPMQWVVRDAATRVKRLRRYFEVVVPLYAKNGAVWVSDDGPGAALWAAPGRWPFPLADQVRALRGERPAFSRWPRHGWGSRRAIERGHPHGPHWYLDYIGVAPAAHGRGLGTAVLEPGLARCDAEGTPAYLHAGSPSSRQLYERHGFVTFSEFRLPLGGPPLWRMWREPR